MLLAMLLSLPVITCCFWSDRLIFDRFCFVRKSSIIEHRFDFFNNDNKLWGNGKVGGPHYICCCVCPFELIAFTLDLEPHSLDQCDKYVIMVTFPRYYLSAHTKGRMNNFVSCTSTAQIGSCTWVHRFIASHAIYCTMKAMNWVMCWNRWVSKDI